MTTKPESEPRHAYMEQGTEIHHVQPDPPHHSSSCPNAKVHGHSDLPCSVDCQMRQPDPPPCRKCNGVSIHARYCELNSSPGFHSPVLDTDRRQPDPPAQVQCWNCHAQFNRNAMLKVDADYFCAVCIFENYVNVRASYDQETSVSKTVGAHPKSPYARSDPRLSEALDAQKWLAVTLGTESDWGAIQAAVGKHWNDEHKPLASDREEAERIVADWYHYQTDAGLASAIIAYGERVRAEAIRRGGKQ